VNKFNNLVEKKELKTELEIKVLQVGILFFLARANNRIVDFIVLALRRK
jgi:hypothetical protein